MNLVLALTCDHAELRPDGKLDVTGIFNELYAPGFPAAQDRMMVVFVLEWEREDEGRVQFRADLVDDDDQKVLSIQGHTDISTRADDRAPAQTRLVMPLEKIVFPHAGRYRFVLSARGETHPGCAIFLGEHADDG